jgi:hypothetical protein
MQTLDIDPASAAVHWTAIGSPQPDLVSVAGHGILDVAALGLFKAERLAASAGAVPWIRLPGGGLGVIQIGRALSAPKSAWKEPTARNLYLANHKVWQSIHDAQRPAKASTPPIILTQASPGSIPSLFSDQIGAIPALVYVAIAAVGVLATIGTAYYATRTEEQRIETESQRLRAAHAVGSLSDLAATQLATQGKIDPNLIAQIGALGESSWTPSAAHWALAGAAATAGLGLGGYLFWQRRKAAA